MATSSPSIDPQLARARRRWWSFSLRGFFIGLTLLGVWLGVQAKWVHDRRAALEDVIQRDGHASYGTVPSAAPWRIRLLRGEGISNIKVSDKFSAAERARLESLFPEAQLFENVRFERTKIKRQSPGDIRRDRHGNIIPFD